MKGMVSASAPAPALTASPHSPLPLSLHRKNCSSIFIPPPQNSVLRLKTHHLLLQQQRLSPFISSSSSSSSTSSVTEQQQQQQQQQQQDSPSLPSPPSSLVETLIDDDDGVGPSSGCKGCGKEQIERGCNGEGRIQGGIATIPGFGWWPIKAYRPCPGFLASGGNYRRRGQSMDEVAFGGGKQGASMDDLNDLETRKKGQDRR